MMSESGTKFPVLGWTPLGRTIVFVLAGASIWSLLAEFYGFCSMRVFTLCVMIPATLLLMLISIMDLAKGDRRLWRAVLVGAVGGFIAACAYDFFRLPFVIAAVDQTGPLWLRLPLYKVFPRFGAMILGQSFTATQADSQFTLMTHVIGWSYHFSNGITFGVMYMSAIGDARRRSWWWAVVMAVALELAMLFTPYTGFFGIGLTTRFVIVTLSAHLIFGVSLGWYVRSKADVRGPALA